MNIITYFENKINIKLIFWKSYKKMNKKSKIEQNIIRRKEVFINGKKQPETTEQSETAK